MCECLCMYVCIPLLLPRSFSRSQYSYEQSIKQSIQINERRQIIPTKQYELTCPLFRGTFYKKHVFQFSNLLWQKLHIFFSKKDPFYTTKRPAGSSGFCPKLPTWMTKTHTKKICCGIKSVPQ